MAYYPNIFDVLKIYIFISDAQDQIVYFQSCKKLETLYFITTIKYKYKLCLLKLKVITSYFIRVVIDGSIFFIQAVTIQSLISSKL